MLKHEAKLINPNADEIVAALSEAVAAANKRCRARLLDDDPKKWQKFARDCAAEPEGYAMFRGGRGGVPATQLLAAWWTDAIGRKHVVLRGRRVEHDEAKRLLQKDELDKRTPLWHAYPEYVCRRTVGSESQIVCACGCGAVGTPTALGWMGETCGPCFDRKEELGTGALRENLPGVLYGDRAPLGAVACSPDGTRVAAKEGDSSVSYWDIVKRTRTTVKFSGHPVNDIAITSDARYLLVTGVGLVAGIGLWAAFDLNTDPPTRIEPTLEYDPMGYRVVAMSDPRFAILHRHEAHLSRAEMIRVPSGEPVRGINLPLTTLSGRLTLSSDGKQLAALSGQISLVDVSNLTLVGTLDGYYTHAIFSTDGKRFCTANSGALSLLDLVTQKRLAKATTSIPLGEPVTALVIDPVGEFVYVGSWLGKVYAFTSADLKLRATFEWHLGAIVGLTVSADGSRLFSSGTDGCVKVWPIRDLMKGT